MRERNREAAEAAREAGREIADLVHSKQLAYGDAASLQHGLWGVLLEQYRAPANVQWMEGEQERVSYNPNGHYVIPVELFDHVPRLTRVFDRVARIVANPGQDRLGEDPWMDLCGDAMVGIIMPRTSAPDLVPVDPSKPADHTQEFRLEGQMSRAAAEAVAGGIFSRVAGAREGTEEQEICGELHPIHGHPCEVEPHGPEEDHRYVHAGGLVRWRYVTENAVETFRRPGPHVDVGAGVGGKGGGPNAQK